MVLGEMWINYQQIRGFLAPIINMTLLYYKHYGKPVLR